MPIAIAVGRRIVLLTFTLILILAAILCAKTENYEWHLGARMVLGLCAGQSEALVPMITQVYWRKLQRGCERMREANLRELGNFLPAREKQVLNGSTSHSSCSDYYLDLIC
jgi:hypothetical protein